MEDILRDLFEGRYSGRIMHKPEDDLYKKAEENTSKLSAQIIESLKSHGVENAEELVSEWIAAWFQFTDEELYYCFKKGVKLGFQLIKEVKED